MPTIRPSYRSIAVYAARIGVVVGVLAVPCDLVGGLVRLGPSLSALRVADRLSTAMLVATVIACGTFVIVFFMNLGRAPDRLDVGEAGVSMVIDGVPMQIAWDDVVRLRFRGRGAWALELTSGKTLELWPYAWPAATRAEVRRLLESGFAARRPGRGVPA